MKFKDANKQFLRLHFKIGEVIKNMSKLLDLHVTAHLVQNMSRLT